MYNYREVMTEISLDEFTAQGEAFLDANASRKVVEEKFVWGNGSDVVGMFEEKDRNDELEDLKRACEWRAKKFDAGFGWISGPKAFGGRELPHAYQRSFDSLEGRFQVPKPELLHDRARHGGADDRCACESSREGEVRRADVPRRHRRMPVVQ